MPPSITTPLSSLTARDLYGVWALAPAGVVPFGYTGHAEDPTGLTWGRARCYAPRTGGWTGEDPVFTEPRYAYVGGHPSWGTDPDGRASLTGYGLIVGLISACAATAMAFMWQRQKATEAAQKSAIADSLIRQEGSEMVIRHMEVQAAVASADAETIGQMAFWLAGGCTLAIGGGFAVL